MSSPVLREALAALLADRPLDGPAMEAAMGAILAGEGTPAQVAGFAVALRMRGETTEQIAAAASPLFDRPVANLGHLQKMRPSAVRTLGNFPRLDTQWADLIATLDTLDTPAVERDPIAAFYAMNRDTITAVCRTAFGWA